MDFTSADDTTLEIATVLDEYSAVQCKKASRQPPPTGEIPCSHILQTGAEDEVPPKLWNTKPVGVDASYVDSIANLKLIEKAEKDQEDVVDSAQKKRGRRFIEMGVDKVEDLLGFSHTNFEECEIESLVEDDQKADLKEIAHAAKQHFSVEEIMQLNIMSKEVKSIVRSPKLKQFYATSGSDELESHGTAQSTPVNEPEDDVFGWTVTPHIYKDYAAEQDLNEYDFQDLYATAKILTENTVDEALIMVNSWMRSIFIASDSQDSDLLTSEEKKASEGNLSKISDGSDLDDY